MPAPCLRRSATWRGADGRHEGQPLADWDALDAYVLLGEPGGGKTTALVAEQDAGRGVFVRARDFINAPDDGWQQATLLIDALDVAQAGAGRP